MSKKIQTFFKNLSQFLSTHIAPVSNELDHDVTLLKSAYQQLAELDSLRLLIPTEYGGFGGERSEWIQYNVQMAKVSGALLFLQAQHQFAVSQLKKLLPHAKVQETLQYVADSDHGLGISLAANRKLLAVKSVEGGFRVTGELRWVTGFDYFPDILCSFDFNEVIYYTFIPFQTLAQSRGSLSISEKIATAVFSSTNTVRVSLENWFVPDSTIIATQDFSLHKSIEHPSIYNFAGATKALLEIATLGKHCAHPKAEKTYQALYEEWQHYHARIVKSECCPLELRTMGLKLAERCAMFARMICGSEGLLASHPLTRISREIWQYTIAGYTQDQLEAYLQMEKI